MTGLFLLSRIRHCLKLIQPYDYHTQVEIYADSADDREKNVDTHFYYSVHDVRLLEHQHSTDFLHTDTTNAYGYGT